VLDVRNVVWCTGFRPDFSWIQLPLEIGEDGYPVQYRGASTTVGLYFVGLPFLHSFASMLIGGAGRDAERVAAQIAARAQPLVWNGTVGDALVDEPLLHRDAGEPDAVGELDVEAPGGGEAARAVQGHAR
jgi:hypothetical protein